MSAADIPLGAQKQRENVKQREILIGSSGKSAPFGIHEMGEGTEIIQRHKGDSETALWCLIPRPGAVATP